MRAYILLLVLAFGFGSNTCGHGTNDASLKSGNKPDSVRKGEHATAQSDTIASRVEGVDFATQIRPMLEARCRPCHFAGGTVYQRLPFDRPETITTLGTKLFTRIKDEKEQRLVAAFLSQQSAGH